MENYHLCICSYVHKPPSQLRDLGIFNYVHMFKCAFVHAFMHLSTLGNPIDKVVVGVQKCFLFASTDGKFCVAHQGEVAFNSFYLSQIDQVTLVASKKAFVYKQFFHCAHCAF